MANEIKLKRGSGSDPGASDLVVGEVALRTDSGQLFTKKDNGTVVEIGAASGVSDGDKGDITVSNSGATFTIDNNAVTFAKIQDIPQNRILGRTASGSGDATTLTAANVRSIINVEDGATADQSASEILTLIKTVDGAGSGLDADTLDSISSGSFLRSDIDDLADRRIVFANNSNDNEDTIATSTSGQGGLEVFNSGSGNDAFMAFHTGGDFALYFGLDADANKLAVGGWSMGANKYAIYHEGNNPTFSQLGITASNINALGINATTLDSIDSGSFVRSDADDTMFAKLTISRSSNEKLVLAGSNDPFIRFQEGTTNKAYIEWNSSGYLNLVNSESSESLRIQSGSSGLKFVEGGNVRNVYHTGNLSIGDGGLTSNNFTDADHSKLNGIAAGATNVTNNNQLTNGAGYLTSSSTLSSSNLSGALPAIDGSNLTGIAAFPSGTRMLFQQTSAPTGWTKDTSSTNNRALRVVSGSAGSGGSVAFTTAFSSQSVSGSVANTSAGGSIGNTSAGGSVSNHTLSVSQMPAHTHTMRQLAAGLGCGPNIPQAGIVGTAACNTNSTSAVTFSTGGGGSHNHGFSGSSHNPSFSGSSHNHSFSGTSINLAVQYLDVIIAQKN